MKEYQNKELALTFLANNLIKGTLVLFLGAGISKGFGFPGWLNFTNKFREKVGLPPINFTSSSTEIQTAIDEALDEIKNADSLKIKFTKEILYSNIPKLDVKLAYSNPLLIAVSSLLMGSRRGHVKRVVTFNYDNMLEWFLSLFGFHVNSIIHLPALEGSEDVRIFHPHGFIPHPDLGFANSRFQILGMTDAERRMGDIGVPWREKEREIIESGVCLFIGMSYASLEDRAIGPLYASVANNITNNGRAELGIWLYFDPAIPLDEGKKAAFFRKSIAPVEINDIDGVHEFILKISQRALEIQNKIR